MDGLNEFNIALKQGLIHLHRGELDKDIFVHLDRPAGEMRFTYVRVDKGIAVALVVLVGAEPVGAEPCFGIGYAVLPNYRGNGIASDLVQSAIAEFRNGFERNGVKVMHIEALVGVENVPSQRVAEKTISGERREAIDSHSGEPALRYIRRFAA